MAKVRRTREERKQDRSERREGRKRLNIVNNKIGDVTVAKEGTRKGQLESKPVLSESQQSDVNKAINAAKSMYQDIGIYDENDFLWNKMKSAANPTEVFKLAQRNVYYDAYGKGRDREKIDMTNAKGFGGLPLGHKLAIYFNEAIPGYGDNIVNEKIKEPVRPEFNRVATPSLKPLPASNLEYSFPEETPVSPYNSNQLTELMSKDKSRKQERELRRDERRSERYNDKRERLLGKVNARIEESEGRTPSVPTGVVDPGVKGKSITTVMKSDGPSIEAYSNTASQEEVDKAMRTQIDYKINQGEVLNGVIQSQANAIPTAGIQLASAVANNPDATLTDLNKVTDGAKAVNDVQSQQDAAIANQAVATNNAVSETPKSEMPAVGAEVAANEVANAEQGGIPSMPIKPAQTIDNAGTQPSERIGGDGSTALNQMQGGAATFDQGLTRQKVQDQVTSGALQGLSSSPVVAIEKLGIQDYFPNAGESINVGSYSGKYIGNTTIFAAPGARVPFGLYDARMRALKEAAVEKQKSIDKILTAPETSAQYQQQFNANFFGENGVQRFIDKHGNNPDAILNDPEFREWMADKQAKARDITQAVSVAKATLDEYAKTGSYIPDKVRDVSMKLLYGQADEFEKYLNGTGSLSKVVEDNLVYMNIFPQVQEYAKTALSPDRLTQSPINMKTGGKYDSETFNKERNEFMSRVMDGSVQQGTDVYASGIAKYFTGDYESAIRSIAAGQNASEEQVEEAIKMFTGMIPKESIIFDYTNIKTDELGWARLREATRQYEETKQANSFWGQISAMQSDQVNKGTGKSAYQDYADIANLSGTALIKAMENHQRTYGAGASMPGAKIKKDDKNNTFVTVIPANQDGKLKTVANTSEKIFAVEVYDKSTGNWVKKNLTAQEIGSSGKRVKVQGQELSSEDKSVYSAAAESMWVRDVEYEVKEAFTDKNGNHQYVKTDGSNLKSFNASNQKYQYVVPVQKAFTREVKFDDVTMKTYYVDRPLPGFTQGNAANVRNEADAMWMDVESGIGAKNAAQTGGTTSTVTVNSGSSSSTEF